LANILIADDEISIRSLLHRIVESMEHTPVDASNGQEALEKFKGNSIALSIVDLNMPEMDGLKYLKAVKKIDSKAVVIIVTGYPSAETIIETIEDDGFTYVAKPIHVEQIKDLIERGLASREARLNEK
jgi:two-component system nitrogen regulation response regulator GlnG